MNVVRSPEHGDDTRLDLRVIVSPAAGTFQPATLAPTDGSSDGRLVVPLGGVLGHVVGPGSSEPVVSFCGGEVIRFLGEPGERVRTHQPLAWIQPMRSRTEPSAVPA